MEQGYKLIRSSRRTVNLQIDRDGQLLVRAPYLVPEREIRRIVEQNADWIRRQR